MVYKAHSIWLHGLQGPLNLGIIGIDLIGSRPSAFGSGVLWFPFRPADGLLLIVYSEAEVLQRKYLTIFNKH